MNKRTTWMTISVSVIAITLISVYITAQFSGSEYNHQRSIAAGASVFIGICATVLSVIALFKVEKWKKIVPICGALIGLFVTVISYVTANISLYGQYH